MPYYNNTVRDTYEDPAVVEVDDVTSDADTRVYLTVRESAKDQVAALSLEPAQARALARALKRAANVAEGKPAKAPKKDAPALPRVIVDKEDDLWFRDTDADAYTCGEEDGYRTTHRPYVDRTRAQIKADYGILEERP